MVNKENEQTSEQEEVMFNLATYMLLPLIELTENSFGEESKTDDELNFINCYLTEENYIAAEVKKWEDVLLTTINTQYYFTDFKTERGTHMILFRVKGSQLSDLENFRNGAYSQLSQISKDKIVMFNGFEDQDYLVRVMNGDAKLKRILAYNLEVPLESIKEAKSKPTDKNFIDITDYMILNQKDLANNE